jgi:hypothetical protein
MKNFGKFGNLFIKGILAAGGKIFKTCRALLEPGKCGTI